MLVAFSKRSFEVSHDHLYCLHVNLATKKNKKSEKLEKLAFIAVGRDLSLDNVFRPPVIEFSDKAVGAEIIKIFKEPALEIKWITTPGHTGDSCSLIIKGENLSQNLSSYDVGL